ncbi:bacitracin ABC transporter permease, partial [Bacillus pseudomycoides]
MEQLVNLLYTELLKLKRSYMLLISIMGAAVAPFMVV